MDDFSLVLAFDTDDPQFVRGVEVGRLWETLKATPDEEVTETIHLVNDEMAMRIGEALNRSVVGEALDDTWMTVTYSGAVEGENPDG